MAELTQAPESAPPAYVWTYNDDDGEEFTGPYATEALARAEAEAEYIGSYTDPASAGTLSWSMLENTPDCYILREDGKSVGIHLWRQEVLGSARPEVVTTADQIRALPVGTVLLNNTGTAVQVRVFNKKSVITTTALVSSLFWCDLDDKMRDLLKHAPFRVLYTPGGDRA